MMVLVPILPHLLHKYNYYSISGIGWGNTISNPCIIRESDSLAFFTFPDFLLESKKALDIFTRIVT